MPVASLVEKIAARDFSANPIPLFFYNLTIGYDFPQPAKFSRLKSPPGC
jgi:hypothetical protein